MGRREDPVVLIEREGSASVMWFLIGGAVGAALALLFAPHSGDQTRRVLGRRITRFRDAADQAFTDLKDAVSRGPERRRAPAGEAPDRQPAEPEDEAAPGAESRRGVTSARRELEQRLSDARARRQRAMADEDEEPVA
jgi:gas vesicle protein